MDQRAGDLPHDLDVNSVCRVWEICYAKLFSVCIHVGQSPISHHSPKKNAERIETCSLIKILKCLFFFACLNDFQLNRQIIAFVTIYKQNVIYTNKNGIRLANKS